MKAINIARTLFLVLIAMTSAACLEPEETSSARDDSTRSEPAAAPPSRPELESAAVLELGAANLADLQRIDLGTTLANSDLVIEPNDPAAIPAIPTIIDGDLESLMKSNAINPLVIDFEFANEISLKTVRLYPAASRYDWLVEALPGGPRFMLRDVPERTWSQLDLPEAVTTSVIRLEVLRVERDDYVHLNEVELYAAAP